MCGRRSAQLQHGVWGATACGDALLCVRFPYFSGRGALSLIVFIAVGHVFSARGPGPAEQLLLQPTPECFSSGARGAPPKEEENMHDVTPHCLTCV